MRDGDREPDAGSAESGPNDVGRADAGSGPGSGPEEDRSAPSRPASDSQTERAGGSRPAEANRDGAARRSSSPDDPSAMTRRLMRLSSVGLEFAGAVLLFGGIGYWIDTQRQHPTPYLGIAGVLLGFVVGMYRLIRVAQDAGGR